MATSRCTPDQAFDILWSSAQTSRVEPDDLAEMIVRSAAGVRGRHVLVGEPSEVRPLASPE